MGSWGMGHFENDTALDWSYELQESDNLNLLTSTIGKVLNQDYIDADDASMAVAALAILAHLKGNSSIEIDESSLEWVEKYQGKLEISDDLLKQGLKALDAIMGNESELKDLWEEEEDCYPAWCEKMLELKQALS
jgi:hypothetical protein